MCKDCVWLQTTDVKWQWLNQRGAYFLMEQVVQGNPRLILLFKGLSEHLGSFCLVAQACRATGCLFQLEAK